MATGTGEEMGALQQVVDLLGVDPFVYLAGTIFGVIVWTWCSVIGDFALTGRGIWLRRCALLAAALGAVLFAYSARTLG